MKKISLVCHVQMFDYAQHICLVDITSGDAKVVGSYSMNDLPIGFVDAIVNNNINLVKLYGDENYTKYVAQKIRENLINTDYNLITIEVNGENV